MPRGEATAYMPATAPDARPLEDDSEDGPIRRCIVTGERHPREALIRFVIDPSETVVPDVTATLPGRGIWVAPRRDAVELARKRRLFERAARRSVKVPADLATVVETLLARRCGETIGLARRAGLALSGFEQVASALRAGPAGAILAARDGAADGRRKVAGLGQDAPLIDVLSAAELGAAFGRERVVHAILRRGRLAQRLALDAARLAGFRDG